MSICVSCGPLSHRSDEAQASTFYCGNSDCFLLSFPHLLYAWLCLLLTMLDLCKSVKTRLHVDYYTDTHEDYFTTSLWVLLSNAYCTHLKPQYFPVPPTSHQNSIGRWKAWHSVSVGEDPDKPRSLPRTIKMPAVCR